MTERWIFGYGSLVWRPAFAYRDRVPGRIRGFTRRFWQGSPDHRGTPEVPGRVVTLMPEPGATCWGMAYQVAASDWAEVLDALDVREQRGYERMELDVHLRGGAQVRALVYVATADNPDYLGPAPLSEIADWVRRCHGPSGPNVEYVLRLAQALEDMGADDDHVSALARLLHEP